MPSWINTSRLLKIFLVLLFGMLPLGSLNAATPAQQPPPAIEPWLDPYIEGASNAPLEILFVFEPNCPPCAETFLRVLPWLRENYISKGLVRLRYQEYARSTDDNKMTRLLHCLPKKVYLETLAGVFALQSPKQATPSEADAFFKPLWEKYALGDEAMQTCSLNQKLGDTIDSQKQTLEQFYSIHSSPVFIFNNSAYRINGNINGDAMQNILGLFLPRS